MYLKLYYKGYKEPVVVFVKEKYVNKVKDIMLNHVNSNSSRCNANKGMSLILPANLLENVGYDYYVDCYNLIGFCIDKLK